MTVTLELRPDTEAAAMAAAQAEGVAVEDYRELFLEQSLPHLIAADGEHVRRQRMEILNRLQGKYAGLLGSSEGFSAHKEEEKVREQRHWQEQA